MTRRMWVRILPSGGLCFLFFPFKLAGINKLSVFTHITRGSACLLNVSDNILLILQATGTSCHTCQDQFGAERSSQSTSCRPWWAAPPTRTCCPSSFSRRASSWRPSWGSARTCQTRSCGSTPSRWLRTNDTSAFERRSVTLLSTENNFIASLCNDMHAWCIPDQSTNCISGMNVTKIHDKIILWSSQWDEPTVTLLSQRLLNIGGAAAEWSKALL